MISPLESVVLFQLGPVPITQAVVTTWVIMVALVGAAFALTRRLDLTPTRRQAALELLVATLDTQIVETTQAPPARYRSFIGTLFLFVLAANWSSLLPGIEPPTAKLETDAALAAIVFASVIWFGVRSGGLWGYLGSFARPTIFMIPLNILESVTRVFSMFVRLFGNVMSSVFVIGIVASLAGLLVPIPLMALDMLTGLVQAYIFAVLAMVFISATVRKGQAEPVPPSPAPTPAPAPTLAPTLAPPQIPPSGPTPTAPPAPTSKET